MRLDSRRRSATPCLCHVCRSAVSVNSPLVNLSSTRSLIVFCVPPDAGEEGVVQAFRTHRAGRATARIDRFGFPGSHAAWLTQCRLDPRLALAAAETIAPLYPGRPEAAALLGRDREQRLLAALAEQYDRGDGLLQGAADVLRGLVPPGPVAARLLGPRRWWPVLIDFSDGPADDVMGQIADEIEDWLTAYPGLELGLALSPAGLRQLRDSASDARALCLLRSAVVPLAAEPDEPKSGPPGRHAPPSASDPAWARSQAEAVLYEWLERLPATRGRFRINACLDEHFGSRRAEVDLLEPAARLAVEIDGHWHFQDANAWRRDRRKDLFLQQRGWLVHRVLAEDVLADPYAVALHLAHLCALQGDRHP